MQEQDENFELRVNSSGFQENQKSQNLQKLNQNESINSLWKQIKKDYKLLKIMGKGSFGEVIQAKHRCSQKIVAIKLLTDLFKDQYQSKKIISEVTILRQLSQMKNNKFTTKILDVITSGDINQMNYIFIVMESSDCDLKQLLNKIKDIEFDEGHIITIMYNSLCALNFIHSANVMHRDIKPANILINHDCEITICDFGLSRTVPTNLLIPKFYRDATNQQNIQKQKLNNEKKILNPLKNHGQSPSRFQVSLKENSQKINFILSPKRVQTDVLKFDFKLESPNYELQNIDKKQIISEQLIGMRKLIQKQKRCLSNHIISRWYRPPEIIFVEKNYNTSVDIWGLGCILGELLFCANNKKIDKKFDPNHRFLFAGKSCFPLSPCEQNKKQKNVNFVNSDDQLKVILNIIGHQDKRDLSFISDLSALEYHKSMSQRQQGNNLRNLFRGSSPELVELLIKMLEFNPSFRPSAAECLKSKIFDQIRVPQLENPALFNVKGKVFEEEIYDYQKCQGLKYSVQDYKLMLLQEIELLHQSLQNNDI